MSGQEFPSLINHSQLGPRPKGWIKTEHDLALEGGDQKQVTKIIRKEGDGAIFCCFGQFATDTSFHGWNNLGLGSLANSLINIGIPNFKASLIKANNLI